MSSTYSPNLLELQGFNENSTTWGIRDNVTFSKIDNMIDGWLVKDLSTQVGVYILTALQGQLDEQSTNGVQFTGLLTAGIQIRIPAVAQLHTYWNNTTGGFNLSIGVLGGTPYILPPGAVAMVRCDGANCFDNLNYVTGNLTIVGTAGVGPLTVTTLNASGGITVAGTSALGAVSTGIISTSTITASGNISTTGNLVVGGTAAVTGLLTASAGAAVTGNLAVTGNATTTGTLTTSAGLLGTMGLGTRFVSGAGPSGGVAGDVWFQIV